MLRSTVIESVRDLRSLKAEWDRLWDVSECGVPLNRCEPLALQLETWFADRRPYIITIWDGEQLVAALPLILVNRKSVFCVAELPNNCWSFGEQLLLDPDHDSNRVMRTLARQFARLPVWGVSLDWIPIENTAWLRLTEELRRFGHVVQEQPRFDVGEIVIPNSQEQLEQTWSKNTRKQIRRGLKGFGELGKCRIVDYDPDSFETQLAQAFRLEHAGWKGRESSSILSSSEATRYFTELSRLWHKEGMLNLEFLMLDDQPVAFDLGSKWKSVVSSCKVSYVESYGQFGPGQVLLAEQIRKYTNQRLFRYVDTIGPMTDATGRFATSTYTVGRIAVSTGSVVGKLGLTAIGSAAAMVRHLRETINR